MMKVLFVGSGNRGRLSPILQYQANSLIDANCSVSYYLIKGKGLFGYVKNIYPLYKEIKRNKYDVVHAHYSMSGFVATIASRKRIVCSLMGSDIQAKGIQRIIIRFFSKFIWSATIVKSRRMQDDISLLNTYVLPNGVNFDHFSIIDKNIARSYLDYENEKKTILFLADPSRYEKNFALAKDAYSLLTQDNLFLRVKWNVSMDLVPYEINAADVVLLTSLWEGSPNIVKEAQACCVPVVATKVGDVDEVIGNTEGCFVTSFEPEDVAEKIKKALAFNARTNGREKISYLDNKIIANKLIEIYSKVIKN